MPTNLLTPAHPVVAAAPSAVDRPARCLHCVPPTSPSRFFARRPGLLPVLGVVLVLAAVGAWISGGAVLLTWDEPIQRFVESHRTDLGDDLFRGISLLGSTKAVLVLGPLLAAVAWRRCRAVGVVVLLAMLSRPLLEFTLKAVVDRDRPDLERLVAGNGPSFPSGHAMAAVALWGLVPIVTALYTRDRRVWWAAMVTSTVLIGAIGASRTYLGVHWFSDVVGGFIVGAFFLLGAERVLERRHATDPCTGVCECTESGAAPP